MMPEPMLAPAKHPPMTDAERTEAMCLLRGLSDAALAGFVEGAREIVHDASGRAA